MPTMAAVGLAINGVRPYTIQKIVVSCMCIAHMRGTKELLDNCFQAVIYRKMRLLLLHASQFRDSLRGCSNRFKRNRRPYTKSGAQYLYW